MTRQIGTTGWKTTGINIIPSDEIYKTVERAVYEGKLTEKYLQEKTGSNLPIIIDHETRTISFY